METTTEINNQSENINELFSTSADFDKSSKKWGCSVCGEESWCGSDGCPLDPQWLTIKSNLKPTTSNKPHTP